MILFCQQWGGNSPPALHQPQRVISCGVNGFPHSFAPRRDYEYDKHTSTTPAGITCADESSTETDYTFFSLKLEKKTVLDAAYSDTHKYR